MPQRPHLFAGTIAENVRLARPEASDEEVARALRDAGAEEFVAALPGGARTALGEGGVGLSAGQRQRLALARAFLADRPVLLLDEPTAALDGETEAAVVDAVRRLAAGRTVLLVVHRPALLAVADRVVAVGTGAAARTPATGPAPGAVPDVAAGPHSEPGGWILGEVDESGGAAGPGAPVPVAAAPPPATRSRGSGPPPRGGRAGSGSGCCSGRWPSGAESA